MITIFTDGGCHSSTGTGGWAAVIRSENFRGVNLSGAVPDTTNNRMELTAAIKALEFVRDLPSRDSVSLTSDSRYVIDGITSWVHGWKAKGWVTSQKEPVTNRDLWEQLDLLNSELDVTWNWVKGHAGNEYNELCDRLTQEAIATVDEPDKSSAVLPAADFLKASFNKETFRAKSVSVSKAPLTLTIKKPEMTMEEIRKIVADRFYKDGTLKDLTVKVVVEDLLTF